jgi:hypothetical protein
LVIEISTSIVEAIHYIRVLIEAGIKERTRSVATLRVNVHPRVQKHLNASQII